MGKINFARVLLSGLVAGLILNVGEFVLNEVVLAKQMQDTFLRLNIPPPGGSFIALAVIMTFVLGVIIILLYAMIRPRFGPGPKTAIIASLIVWFGIYLYTGILNGMLFGIPFGALLIAIVWGLVEYAVAALAGAWLYRES